MEPDKESIKETPGMPAAQVTEAVFSGPISPADQSTLLEFINKHVVIPTVSYLNARSHGSAVTSIPGAFTPTKVTLNNNDFANGITWDSANNRFVIVTAGRYQVNASVFYQSITAGKQYETMIYQNGGQAAIVASNPGTAGIGISPFVSDILNCGVGDTIELYTQHNDAINDTILTGSGFTYLSLARV